MKYIEDYRASKILYNFLVSNKFKGKFILPANVCPIVPLTFIQAKVKFCIVDISESDLCLDQDLTKKLISNSREEYAGIFFVRTYGVDKKFDYFFEALKKINDQLIIIDDRCLAKPEPFLTHIYPADLVLFSTGYAKYVDIGEGGFAFFDDRKGFFNYKKIKTNFVGKDEYLILNDFKVFIASDCQYTKKREYLWLKNTSPSEDYIQKVEKCISHTVQHKKKLNTIYAEIIPDQYLLQKDFWHWRFTILVPSEKKKYILEELFSNQLFASSHYASLCHIFSNKRAPVAEKIHSSVINLFNDRYYTEHQAVTTANIIKRILDADDTI